MYPHIAQAAEVCAEEAERFLIEGYELAPWYPARLQARLEGVTIRACFLGHPTFSAADLASYRGPIPQHETELSAAELEAAAWIRHWSCLPRDECRDEWPPTETGSLVVALTSGSHLPGYAGCAARAIWIVGAQKVVRDLNNRAAPRRRPLPPAGKRPRPGGLRSAQRHQPRSAH